MHKMDGRLPFARLRRELRRVKMDVGDKCPAQEPFAGSMRLQINLAVGVSVAKPVHGRPSEEGSDSMILSKLYRHDVGM